MTVQIAPNIRKQSARVNVNGDEIDPVTKQIVRSVNEGNYVPTPEEMEALAKKSAEVKEDYLVDELPKTITVDQQFGQAFTPQDIQKEIENTKLRLSELEELKKLKIQEMKAQLELLESE